MDAVLLRGPTYLYVIWGFSVPNKQPGCEACKEQGVLSRIIYGNKYIFTRKPSLCYSNQKDTGFSKSGD